MKPIRMGIFGANRGLDYADSILLNNADIVAVCDKNEHWLNRARERFGDKASYYTDFEEFFKHDLDAVLLANYFNEHAPYAIRFLNKGVHVLSECTAAETMADCVALVEAAEKSSAKYMLSENYPFMKFNREIKRVCDTGTLGQIMFAEGEYNHPGSGANFSNMRRFQPFAKHWRNHLPRTHYLPHSLAPIMYATGSEPVRVTAFPIWGGYRGPYSVSHVGDRTAIITTLNHDGSVFRVTGNSTFGAHGNTYRVCGTKGQIENLRGMGGKVALRYNEWDKPENIENAENIYMPEWNDKDEALIEKEGHGGGDFLVIRAFLDCLRNDTKPCFDVYFATKMSAVAILAHRSLLENGIPYDVPDFRKKEDRDFWRNDRLTPFCGPNGEAPTIACSSRPLEPTEEQMKAYMEVISTPPDRIR